MTKYGRSIPSEQIEILTLKSDPPAVVTEEKQTTTTVTVSWRRPTRVAQNVRIEKYEWKLFNEEGFEVRSDKADNIEDQRMFLTIDKLNPGMRYDFAIKVKDFDDLPSWSNGIPINNSHTSQWVSIPVTTLPAKLVNLVMENRTDSYVTVKWQKWQKIPDGAEFLQYKIDFQRLNKGTPIGEVILTDLTTSNLFAEIHWIMSHTPTEEK